MRELAIYDFEQILEDKNTTLLDTRHQNDFVKEHIPNSLFIGIDGPFEKWIQLVIPNKNTPLALVIPIDREKEVINKLSELGYTNVLGYLSDGFSRWKKADQKIESINSISATKFESNYKKNANINIIDVRKINEFETAHLENAQLIPLEINELFLEKCNKYKDSFIFCGGGYRSVIAISYLKKQGIYSGTNIEGGFASIQKTALKVVTSNT